MDGHREGSRKGEVHKVFLKEGKEKALAFGMKKGLKQNSLRSWFSAWKDGKPTAKKAAAKKSAKVVNINDAKKKKKAKPAAKKAADAA